MRALRRNAAFGFVLAVCVAVIVVSTIYRADTQASIEQAVRENCEAIEELKAAEREEAIQSYRNLDRTLRLLGLKRTKEIESVALENRDEALARFAPTDCG